MTVAHWDEVESHHRATGEMDATWQQLGKAAGTRSGGVNRVRVAPGKLPTPPHTHLASEELYFVLAGSGLGSATLKLWPHEGDVEQTPLHVGHVVARPPGTRVSRSFLAGPDGVTMLTYGTREVNDICWYPRSREILWRGVGVMGRIETLEYSDGEPVEDD